MPPKSTNQKPLSGLLGSAKVALITVTDEEFFAVQSTFKLKSNIVGTEYFRKRNEAKTNDYSWVLTQCGDQTNIPMHKVTSDFLEDFRPNCLLLVGIAGGVRGRDDVQLGDVVVADYIDYYEYRKIVDGRESMRRVAYEHPSYHLRQRIARPLSKVGSWYTSITASRPVKGLSKAVVGNIAVGEKLLGDDKNETQKQILNELDRAIAVDMESYGFARSIFESRISVHYNPQCLVIRGISDLVHESGNNKTRKRWRNYAANAAACFAYATVSQLKI